MIILDTGTSGGGAQQLLKMGPNCRFVWVLLLSPFCSSHDQAHGRQDTFACLRVCVAETLETEVTPCTGGDSPLLPTDWCRRAVGTANSWLLGMPGLFRRYFKIEHILSFRWHTYSSVYIDLRWSSAYVHNFFFLPEASKDFIQNTSWWLYWKTRSEGQMQIPHVIMTKEFLNKEMEDLSVLQWRNSNKEISIGQYWRKCQCVNQTCNIAKGRWQQLWIRDIQMPQG